MAKLQRLKPRLATLKPTHQITQPKKNWGNSRGGRQWRRKRQQIFKRDNYTCQVCKRIGIPEQGKDNSLELDHIINIASGGDESDNNLQTICHTCHKIKTQKESRLNGLKTNMVIIDESQFFKKNKAGA